MRFPILSAVVTVTAAAFITPSTEAQEVLGYWDDYGMPSSSVELYVSPTGSDAPTNPGTAPSAPLRSITAALARTNTTTRYTINVQPGTYDEATETFPLSLRAFGTSLETWRGASTAAPDVRPTVGYSFFGGVNDVIQVSSVGNEELPPTVIHGLEVVNGSNCIVIDPGLSLGQTPTSVGVHVRSCWVHDAVGSDISVYTRFGWTATHVIEDNEIGDDECSRWESWGIHESCDGVSTTLIRRNRIFNPEDGIGVFSHVDPDACQPRIFSNIVALTERNVTLEECDAWVVNNTLAFVESVFGGPVQLYGISHTGGTLQLHNNILWHPDDTYGNSADDLVSAGTLVQSANIAYDSIPSFLAGPPHFVTGDQHPGRCASVDLHLTPASVAALGTGTTAQVVDATWPFFPYLEIEVPAASSNYARRDISMDVDGQGRVQSSAYDAFSPPRVDIGADEFSDTYVAMQSPGVTPSTQDAYGTVLPTASTATSRTYSVDLYLSGPPSGSWGLYLGTSFYDTTTSATTGHVLPNSPIYQNALSGIGNILVDLGPNNSVLLGSGPFDATGSYTLTLPLGTRPLEWLEGELWIQIISADPSGRGAVSNGLRVELNDG